MLIAPEKPGRNRKWKTQRLYRARTDGPFRALLIHDNPDDLHVFLRPEELEYLFRVRHLWHCRRRNKTHRIDMCKARFNQTPQIAGLRLRRNLLRQPLPSVAGTLNDLDYVVHSSLIIQQSDRKSTRL